VRTRDVRPEAPVEGVHHEQVLRGELRLVLVHKVQAAVKDGRAALQPALRPLRRHGAHGGQVHAHVLCVRLDERRAVAHQPQRVKQV
jgi:hypothetical protein